MSSTVNGRDAGDPIPAESGQSSLVTCPVNWYSPRRSGAVGVGSVGVVVELVVEVDVEMEVGGAGRSVVEVVVTTTGGRGGDDGHLVCVPHFRHWVSTLVRHLLNWPRLVIQPHVRPIASSQTVRHCTLVATM
jgi:hypothetical protein